MNTNGKEDSYYVCRCRKGDTKAFEVLVVRYQKKIYNIAYRMLGNREDALDMVQETFLSAWKNIDQVKDISVFSAWMNSILVNSVRQKLRRGSSSIERNSIPFEETDTSDCSQDHDSNYSYQSNSVIGDKIQDCINRLQEEFKVVFVMRDIEDLSYENMATTLEMPAGTIRSRLFRARNLMRLCLKRYEATLS